MALGWARDRLAGLDSAGLFRGAERDIDPDYGGSKRMSMNLEIHSKGGTRIGEAYVLDEMTTLEDAIEEEARKVSRDADSEVLEEGTDEERDRLEQDILDDANAALKNPGDRYTDPTGFIWVLIEQES